MLNFEYIINRNTIFINKIIKKYKIKKSIEELINNFDRIFIHDDYADTKRLRLLGIENTDKVDYKDIFDKDGTLIGAKNIRKKRQIQLYVLKKADYLNIEASEKNVIRFELSAFISLYKQLKNLNEIKKIEENAISFYEEIFGII